MTMAEIDRRRALADAAVEVARRFRDCRGASIPPAEAAFRAVVVTEASVLEALHVWWAQDCKEVSTS